MTKRSSQILTENGTVDEGQGAVGIQDMEAFQAWAHLVRQVDKEFTNVSCTMVVYNGGRTINFWDFEGRNIDEGIKS